MTVSTQTNKNTFSGDGSTRTWGYTFDFDTNLSDDYIKIYVSLDDETSTEITSNYELDKESQEITYPTIASGLDPLTSVDKITIIRELPLTQGTSYTTQGAFPATSIEENEDLAILKIQDLKEQVDRAYKKDLNTEYGELTNVKSITFEDGSTMESADGGSVDAISNNTDVNITMNANGEATTPKINFNNAAITKSYIDEDGKFNGDVTGNADTATALETARTIAGQSFDGTANITIASTDLTDTSNIARLDVDNNFSEKQTTDIIGDVYASNGTSKILDNGTNGTDAEITADVVADDITTRTASGNLLIKNSAGSTITTFTNALTMQGTLEGTMKLIQEINITSNTTDIDITGLNGDVDEYYEFVVKAKLKVTSGTGTLRLRINNDSGATNYRRQRTSFNSSTLEGGVSSQSFIDLGFATLNNGISFGKFNLTAKTGEQRYFTGNYNDSNGPTTNIISGYWTNIADNITSMKIIAGDSSGDLASGILAGTKILIYAKR